MPETRADFFNSIQSKFPFGLGSDNHSAVHPRIFSAMEKINFGMAPSYGSDPVTSEAIRIFRSHFGEQTEVHFCFNGTAANVLAIQPFVSSHHSVVCTDVAHINVDECGAPEKLLGIKLIPVRSVQGKLTPELIAPVLIRRGDQHFSQVKVVSITQPTELGTMYSEKEFQEIVAFCKKNDLWLHIDGARFVNVAARTSNPADENLLRKFSDGADSLSFGGTKNGLLFGEAVLFLSERARAKSRDFAFTRKQFLQLPSKTRYIAAQFIEFLGTDLWRDIATTSCQRALELRKGLEERKNLGISLTQPTQSNAVFAIFERSLEKRLRQFAFFYIWDEATREARLMTTWSTTSSDIQRTLTAAESGLTQ